MTLHLLQTGTVEIKRAQKQGKGSARLLNVFLDNGWTPPLPIYAWALEHPEGVIVVDTGMSSRYQERGYLPAWHPYYRNVRFHVEPRDEINAQLQNIGIRSDDVCSVILTHLHSDHACGIEHFPKCEIWMHPNEYAAAQGFGGQLNGYLPQHFPAWLKPKPIVFAPEKFGAFEACWRVTKAGDVLVVPTYGHTPAHVSVIVQTNDVCYFLAGDTSYSQELLRAKKVDGVSPNAGRTLQTMETILEFARTTPTLYLPAHDPDNPRRLAACETI
jgi:glyoxylase-like metal-dependent hydrolase (beta-lactamase superfamily II)